SHLAATAMDQGRWGSPLRDCLRHGWRGQAYMDVFTACPAKGCPAGPPPEPITSKTLQPFNGSVEGGRVLGEAQAGQAVAGGWGFVDRGQGDGRHAVCNREPAAEFGVVQVAYGRVVDELEVAAGDVQWDQARFQQLGAEAVALFLVEGAELFV